MYVDIDSPSLDLDVCGYRFSNVRLGRIYGYVSIDDRELNSIWNVNTECQ